MSEMESKVEGAREAARLAFESAVEDAINLTTGEILYFKVNAALAAYHEALAALFDQRSRDSKLMSGAEWNAAVADEIRSLKPTP